MGHDQLGMCPPPTCLHLDFLLGLYVEVSVQFFLGEGGGSELLYGLLMTTFSCCSFRILQYGRIVISKCRSPPPPPKVGVLRWQPQGGWYTSQGLMAVYQWYSLHRAHD
jgi:hypothetical protein